jgi:hypothetical protein
MANFLLLYRGGGMPQTDEDKQRVMAAWNKWMTDVDGDLVDAGNPTSNVKTVKLSGTVEFASDRVTGYSVIQADSMEHAVEKAKGVPIIAEGGSVDVYETFNAV